MRRAVTELPGPWLRQWTRSFKKTARIEDLDNNHLIPTVALIGRPNVGKSALFNRLVRRREALVFDTPGSHVTRDYREGLGQLADLQFKVIDTSGLEPFSPSHTLQGRACSLTAAVLQRSDLALMIIDATSGVVPADEQLASWLIRVLPHGQPPLLLVANKAETKVAQQNMAQTVGDSYCLNLGCSPVAISATTGEGMADLYVELQPHIDAAAARLQQQYNAQAPPGLIPAAAAAAGEGREAAGTTGSSSSGSGYQSVWAAADHTSSTPVVTNAEGRGSSRSDVLQAPHRTPDPSASGVLSEDEADALLQQYAAAAGSGAQADGVSDAEFDAEFDAEGASGWNGGRPPGAAEQGTGAVAAADAAAGAGVGRGARPEGPLRLVIMGLPNSGKSTLMNQLLGWERSLTGPEAGLTRDPTSAWLNHKGMPIQLIDTAGWVKRAARHTQGAGAPPTTPTTAVGTSPSSKGTAGQAGGAGAQQQQQGGVLEPELRAAVAAAALQQAERALAAAHVVVLLLDATRLLDLQQAITKQELELAAAAVREGKALVVAVNKVDAVEGGQAAAEELRRAIADRLEARFLEAGRLEVLGLSAARGEGTQELLDRVVDAYVRWNTRFPTHRLLDVVAQQQVRFMGRGLAASLLKRIKWIAQVRTRPPGFVLLLRGGEKQAVDEGGQRFIANMLREALGLHQLPMRLYLRYNTRPSTTGEEGRRSQKPARQGRDAAALRTKKTKILQRRAAAAASSVRKGKQQRYR